jgi:hypothetical protein
MAAPRYIYQRRGGPIVRWDHESGRPPSQTRGADASSMGSLGDAPPSGSLALTMAPRRRYRNTTGWNRPLPKPGAPEYLGGLGSLGDDPPEQAITQATLATNYMPAPAAAAAVAPVATSKSKVLLYVGGALAAVAILFGGK